MSLQSTADDNTATTLVENSIAESRMLNRLFVLTLSAVYTTIMAYGHRLLLHIQSAFD